MPRVFHLAAAAIVILALCGGCGGSESDADLQQIDTALHSWSSTLDLVTTHGRARSVPHRYVDQTIKAIDEDLDKLQKKIDKAADPKTRRTEVRDRLAQVRTQLDALRKEHQEATGSEGRRD